MEVVLTMAEEVEVEEMDDRIPLLLLLREIDYDWRGIGQIKVIKLYLSFLITFESFVY